MRAICISESYCQYKTDTGYCGYTGMGCVQSLVRSVKYEPKVSLVHQVELTDDCIDQIAEAVAKKLRDGDTIYRQAAIDALEEPCKVSDTWTDEYAVGERSQWEKDVKALNGLPSAERHGRWMMHIDDLFPAESTMECDQCHEEQPLECDDKYCPNCGAKMERSEE